jgi:hypothetical protein
MFLPRTCGPPQLDWLSAAIKEKEEYMCTYGAIESIVVAIRATRAGGKVRIAVDAKSLIFDVTAARPAMSVNDSKL